MHGVYGKTKCTGEKTKEKDWSSSRGGNDRSDRELEDAMQRSPLQECSRSLL
jgi:hypothetical protein